MNGIARVFLTFKPQKAILTELIRARFESPDGRTADVAISVDDSADLLLLSAYAGNRNCFPHSPGQNNAIPGQALCANSLGGGIAWPTLNAGIDLHVQFAIEESVLHRAPPPPGFTQADLLSVSVIARMFMLGPSIT